MVRICEWCIIWILWNNNEKNTSFVDFVNKDHKIAYICINEWRKIFVDHRMK